MAQVIVVQLVAIWLIIAGMGYMVGGSKLAGRIISIPLNFLKKKGTQLLKFTVRKTFQLVRWTLRLVFLRLPAGAWRAYKKLPAKPATP